MYFPFFEKDSYRRNVNITPLHLAALAVAARDEIEVVGTRPPISRTDDFLYTGVLDSKGRKWTVKYPRHSQAGTILEAEAGIAPALLTELQSGKLPFDVLRPAGFTAVKHGRAMVYRSPVGRTKDFSDFTLDDAQELGRALAAIHNLNPEVINKTGMPSYTADAWRKRLLAALHDASTSATIPGLLLRRWERALEDTALWNFHPCVSHGDVAEENILWSEGQISCFLGFGEANLSDGARDFANLSAALPEDVFDAAFASYQNAREEEVDENFLTRSLLMSELAIPRWLMHGVRSHDEKIITEAQKMLDDLLEAVAADPELNSEPSWEVAPLNAEIETVISTSTAVTALSAASAPSAISAPSANSAPSASSTDTPDSAASDGSAESSNTPHSAESAE